MIMLNLVDNKGEFLKHHCSPEISEVNKINDIITWKLEGLEIQIPFKITSIKNDQITVVEFKFSNLELAIKLAIKDIEQMEIERRVKAIEQFITPLLYLFDADQFSPSIYELANNL